MTQLRPLGHVLLWLGFLGAAVVSVRKLEPKAAPAETQGAAAPAAHAAEHGVWQTVEWHLYLPFLAVGVMGVVILRATAKAHGTQSHKVDADLKTIEAGLGRIIERLEQLNRDRAKIGVYQVHTLIDDHLVADLGLVADARDAIAHRYGLQQYANLMTEFATGERGINRVWSASADGYIDEVWTYMQRAEMRMKRARELLADYQEKSKK